MYFIGLKNGKQHGGNDGTMQVHGFTSPNRKTALAAKAKNWARATDNDEVYAIGSYSQEMSEMSPDDFVKAVRKSGKLLYKSSRTEGKKDTSMKLTLNESVHEGDLVKCPSCGKVDQVDNIRKPSCRNCGKDLRKTISDYNKGIFNFGNDDEDEGKVTESKNTSGKLSTESRGTDMKITLNEGSENLNKSNVIRALNGNPHSSLITIVSALEKMNTETVEEEEAVKAAVSALRKVIREVDMRGE